MSALEAGRARAPDDLGGAGLNGSVRSLASLGQTRVMGWSLRTQVCYDSVSRAASLWKQIVG